ncbi:Aste57867_25109 [Aphanomyces stellatus]|uniref:Aste57867_25109 protein n=1 Tax=Aphanomyces stellatus TaxID=120398 RepID=A0A485LWS1_9STRA|nr:hypothetical protein As57867_025031 [Aphanomyces stellatus]VFU01740.1 Aste57867_25109 [Aphanomyces stellatus]
MRLHRNSSLPGSATAVDGGGPPHRKMSLNMVSLLHRPHHHHHTLREQPPPTRAMAAVWSDEPISNPMKYLFSEEEQFSDVLCPRCSGYLNPALVQALPPPWKELAPDGDDASGFYDDQHNRVMWTPPPGCSAAARRVFAANGTIVAVCSCRISWERRRFILKKIRVYATKYKEQVHQTLATELRYLLAACASEDESCNL